MVCLSAVQATTKEAVKTRLDADLLAALRATGDGWQTRINDTLRASMLLARRIEGEAVVLREIGR